MDWSLFLGLLVGGAKKYILKDKILHEFKLLKLNAIQDYRVFNLTSWFLNLYLMVPTLKHLIHSDTNTIIYLFYHIMSLENNANTYETHIPTILLLKTV